MKVAFLFGTMGRGGAERMISHLANMWVELGESISIITLDNLKPEYELDDRVELIQMGIAKKSKNIFEAIGRNFSTVKYLKSLICKEKFDVVVSFQMKSAINLIIAAPFKREYCVIASERANPAYDDIGKLEKLLRFLVLPKVDGFIFQTNDVSQCYPYKIQKKSTVIPNGIFPEILPEPLKNNDMRKYEKICAVGRLAEQKGYDDLIYAFSEFVLHHPDYKLNIYGEGPLRQKLMTLVNKLNLQKSIMFHGSVDKVPYEIYDAGMYVLSSRFEGMPNALMEALACGVPSIATDCNFGPRDLIVDHQNGILIGVGDRRALVKAMGELADDKLLSNKLSEQAVLIRNTHSGANIAKMYHEYLNKVIMRKRKMGRLE